MGLLGKRWRQAVPAMPSPQQPIKCIPQNVVSAQMLFKMKLAEWEIEPAIASCVGRLIIAELHRGMVISGENIDKGCPVGAMHAT